MNQTEANNWLGTGGQFERLLSIMATLREKCPWDQKQTIDSLRPLTIEELYELSETILNKDWQGIKEELGDLLLHLVFYAQIASEQPVFTMQDVIEGVCQKLINRHPHIYSDVVVNNAEEVTQNWEKLKLEEGKRSVLAGVPEAMPALNKAWRMQEKARKVGFEWEKKEDVWKKVEEELEELEQAGKADDIAQVEEEFGDLLFSLVNYARFLQVDPETALEKTNRKFKRRFMQMEKIAEEQNLKLYNMNLEQMDEIWSFIKQSEKR